MTTVVLCILCGRDAGRVSEGLWAFGALGLRILFGMISVLFLVTSLAFKFPLSAFNILRHLGAVLRSP